MEYLLDTNVVSEPLRPQPAAGIMRGLRAHESVSAIPAPVWHELRFGCTRLPRSRRRAVIERYLEEVVLASFPVLAYDRDAADWHALERARLSRTGQVPPFVDGQIAAIAYVNGLTLITSNTSHFLGFKGLRVQSWT
ncbi:MAG: type II toxin-antitoxin system VapC family toxin [Desulfurellaceae bacterium]|nr:type II toxin-antitoxin system VapC family toxin [Desulfurellaceae bacterium]